MTPEEICGALLALAHDMRRPRSPDWTPETIAQQLERLAAEIIAYAQHKQHLSPAAQRTLAVLQAEPDAGWIDMDRLLALAEIHTAADDLDTRINVIATVLDQLDAAGYQTEMSREVGGDFYRLIKK